MMRMIRVAMLAATATMLAGCPDGGGASGGLSLPGTNRPPSAAGQGRPSDGYTILLRVFNEPDHPERARQAKEDLLTNYKWTDVFAVTHDDRTELFRGHYVSLQQAQPDLKKAKAFVVGGNVRPFAQSMVVLLPGAQVGPPEWDLASCTGEYSLLIAVFENGPTADPPGGYYSRCKEDAVEYCRQLRDQGEAAFYHHGPNKSSVTIGCFPSSSIRITHELIRQSEEPEPVRVRKVEIVDPVLKTLQGKFPKLLLNGRTFFLTAKDAQGKVIQQTEAETYPVRVPERDGSLSAGPAYGGAR